MKITAELLESILNRCPDNAVTSKWIAAELERIEKIETDVDSKRRKQIELREQWERVKKDLDADIKDIQKTCPHYIWRFFPDAAGGHDSFNRCPICGKEES